MITCTLILTAKEHKSHLSSDYSTGGTGVYTQVKAAVTQDLIKVNTKTLIGFNSVWRHFTAFKQYT